MLAEQAEALGVEIFLVFLQVKLFIMKMDL